MPFHPIHLAQTATARGVAKSVGTSAKDAQIINGLFDVATNPLLGTKTVYVSKRAGSTANGVSIATAPKILKVAGGNITGISGYLAIGSDGTFARLVVASGSTSLGNVGAHPSTYANNMGCDLVVSGNQVVSFTTTSGGWYLWENAITTNNPTFTGTTNGTTNITGITSTTGIYPGQLLTGTGILAGTRVATIVSATAITVTQSTSSGGAITITKEPVAKIIDADFPTSLLTGTIVQLDGYFFAADSTGNIYQSALNDPSSWAATDVLNADYSGDELLLIFKIGNNIGAAGAGGSIQYFYNAGNASGSILSEAQNLNLLGVQTLTTPLPFAGSQYCIATSMDSNQSGPWGLSGLYRIDGVNTFTRVSDDEWSSIISSLQITMLSSAVIGGKHVLVLHTSSGISVSPVYDPSNGQFSLLQLATGNYVSGSATGDVFTRSSSQNVLIWATGNTWTDETVAYTMTVQTEPQDMNNGMDATDVWVDLLADTESSGTATLSYTDNDYATWVDAPTTFDMTSTKKRVGPLPVHNQRAYRVTHSANTGFRGQILRVNFAQATV